MKNILRRALLALEIIFDIIWISIMATLVLAFIGVAGSICYRVIVWGYNLLPLCLTIFILSSCNMHRDRISEIQDRLKNIDYTLQTQERCNDRLLWVVFKHGYTMGTLHHSYDDYKKDSIEFRKIISHD